MNGGTVGNVEEDAGEIVLKDGKVGDITLTGGVLFQTQPSSSKRKHITLGFTIYISIAKNRLSIRFTFQPYL